MLGGRAMEFDELPLLNEPVWNPCTSRGPATCEKPLRLTGRLFRDFGDVTSFARNLLLKDG